MRLLYPDQLTADFLNLDVVPETQKTTRKTVQIQTVRQQHGAKRCTPDYAIQSRPACQR